MDQTAGMNPTEEQVVRVQEITYSGRNSLGELASTVDCCYPRQFLADGLRQKGVDICFKQKMAYYWKLFGFSIEVWGDYCVDQGQDKYLFGTFGGVDNVIPKVPYVLCCIPEFLNQCRYPFDPRNFSLSDLRQAFCTSAQLWDMSPIRAWSHTMLVFLKALATGVGIYGIGLRGCPFLQIFIP